MILSCLHSQAIKRDLAGVKPHDHMRMSPDKHSTC